MSISIIKACQIVTDSVEKPFVLISQGLGGYLFGILTRLISLSNKFKSATLGSLPAFLS